MYERYTRCTTFASQDFGLVVEVLIIIIFEYLQNGEEYGHIYKVMGKRRYCNLWIGLICISVSMKYEMR